MSGLRVSGRIGRELISTWCGSWRKKRRQFRVRGITCHVPLVWAENLKLADPGALFLRVELQPMRGCSGLRRGRETAL